MNKTIELTNVNSPVTSVIATTIGATVESSFRSAMNSLLNTKLAGKSVTQKITPRSLFPLMHIQIPSRIIYFNGMKEIRRKIQNFEWLHVNFPTFSLVLSAVTPGLLLTPVVSCLEAVNVKSSVPLSRRWMIGYAPRSLREICFGVGINQCSDITVDFFRLMTESNYAATLLGSITAGGFAGYVSQIPHLISTVKLMNPHLGYRSVVRRVVKKCRRRFFLI